MRKINEKVYQVAGANQPLSSESNPDGNGQDGFDINQMMTESYLEEGAIGAGDESTSKEAKDILEQTLKEVYPDKEEKKPVNVKAAPKIVSGAKPVARKEGTATRRKVVRKKKVVKKAAAKQAPAKKNNNALILLLIIAAAAAYFFLSE